MTIEQITTFLTGLGNVRAMQASAEQGDPEVAWGDWFYYAIDSQGESPKMPFATIVIKDYPGFDEASQLNRPGLFRLNIELGKKAFRDHFGFESSTFDPTAQSHDFTRKNQLFPHPVYATYGWASIINPEDPMDEQTRELLTTARQRALNRLHSSREDGK